MFDNDKSRDELDVLTARILAGDIPEKPVGPTAPDSLTGEVVRCDICGTTGSGRLVSAAQMRKAVISNGFDPFTFGLFSRELLSASGVSPAKAYENWQRVVQSDDTDWNLCSLCFEGVQPYLKSSQSQVTSRKGCGAAAVVIIGFLVVAALALVVSL